MKKILSLLLLPSLVFAGKIGENYVGVELGSTNFDFKFSDPTNSVATDANGFSWSFSGNYNLYQPNTAQYGVDLGLSYLNGSGDDSAIDTDGDTWTTDTDLSVFTLTIRPHYNLGAFKVFADLGLVNQDYEVKVNTTNLSGDSSEFFYGLGFELSLSEKFSIQPSVTFNDSVNITTSESPPATFNGNDTVAYLIPVSYSYSEHIDITASFSAINNDDFVSSTTSTVKVKSESTSWGIGIDYKF